MTLRDRLKTLWPAPVVFLACLAAYLPALRGGFIWDDDYHVTQPALRSLHGLARIWLVPGSTAQYYPVLHSAFWLEHRLWGDAPLGYHLLNVVLHATAACLFALALLRLNRRPAVAWAAALLFALHPVCVESVAWVSEQKNTLSIVFYLLAALLYLRWRDRDGADSTTTSGSACLYVLATAAFALAVLSKSVAASLPAALLVVVWWRTGSLSWRRDVRPLLPWFVFAVAAGLFTAWVERRYIGATGAGYALSPAERLLIAGRAICFYAGKLAWPSHLVFIYPRWNLRPTSPAQWLPVLAVLAGFAALAEVSRRRGLRGPLAAALLFAGTLFPALGFFNVFPFAFSFVADHFQYLADLAPIALAAELLAGLVARLPARAAAARVLFGGLVLGLAAVLGSLSFAQARTYADAATLYRATLERNPGCWLAEINLGVLEMEAKRPAQALPHFESALRIKPDSAEAEVDLGDALQATGRANPAMNAYLWAIKLRPGYAQAHYDLAVVMAAEGRYNEAIDEYRTAARLNPYDSRIRGNLAEALRKAGDADGAIDAARAALRLDPRSAEHHNTLAACLAAAGRPGEALAEVREALRLRPDYAEARLNLGNLERAQGDLADALASYRQALANDPNLAAGHYDLGVLLAATGSLPEAVGELRAAVRLQPDYPEAENGLGNALAATGEMSEAVDHYRRALELAPKNPRLHYNLALALHRLGREDEARRELESARRLGYPAPSANPNSPPP